MAESKHPKQPKLTLLSNEWLTVEEASRAMGKSARTVERLAESGAIETKFQPVAGRKPVRLFRAGDVEQPKKVEKKPKPAHALVIEHQPKPVPPPAQQLTLPALAEMLFALRSEVPLTEKLWLSLEEAQALSGLARNDLLRLCQEKKLTARKSGGWRILRRSLEAFEG
jgi:helix-turn-helix protein